MRQATGSDFIIIYRLSMLDLRSDGSSRDEVRRHAVAIEKAGASMINTGIGWHEARIPTIASVVPEAAFSWVSGMIRQHVAIPVITSNRINSPQRAEQCLQNGDADMVSMARPFLADSEFMRKALDGRPELINTCIACNQGCLDHVFSGRRASCLVNPRACYETEYPLEKAASKKTIIVVGLGMAGLSCAFHAAMRGHHVIAYDADNLGGQFNLAAEIPGKESYARSIRYFDSQLSLLNVEVHRNHRVSFEDLRDCFADAIVIATGVTPAIPAIPGIDHFSVMDYVAAIRRRETLGKRVAIIGAGGIGFDVAEMLVANNHCDWYQQWGIDRDFRGRGGLLENRPDCSTSRSVYLLQRKKGKPGKTLPRTTGWIRRLSLRRAGVNMLSGVSYEKIDDFGLHITHHGRPVTLAVDHVIICAGQHSENSLYGQLENIGQPVHLIGGAHRVRELDAEAAIREGMELAYSF